MSPKFRWLALVAGLGLATAAHASLPVRHSATGCVIGGTFVSASGYRYDIRDRESQERIDLSRFEGDEIRIRGHLLPGDRFYLDGPPRRLGPCPR